MKTPVLFPLFLLSAISFFPYSLSGQNCQAAFAFGSTDITIQFTDQSTSSAGDPVVSWNWDFGDGNSSTQQNPLHTFPEPGKYDVCLTITTSSGCTDQLCVEIETCILQVTADVGDCNGDNEIPVSVIISDPYGAAKDINISVDGVLLNGSPFNIDDDAPVSVSFTVPGDGLQHTLTVQSEDVGTCMTTYTFTVPDCTSDCFLSSMSVNAVGGITHNVDVGDNFFSPENTTIVIADLVRFTWVGDGHSTTSDATTGPDSWNSGEIGFGSVFDVNITNPGTHPFYCIPHGGPGGVGMSGLIIANCPPSGTFDLEVTFSTSVANPQGYNLFVDGSLQPGSPFSYTGTGLQSVNISLSGDGQNHVIEVQDVTDPSCTISRNYLAPDCGAAPMCSLTPSAMQVGGCNANNSVDVEVTVQAINPGSDGFIVLVDGNQSGGTFTYNGSGTTSVTVSVPGDGQNHTIEVQDITDSGCSGTTTVTTQNCTIPCTISNLVATTGSSVTHTVEVQDFQFSPANITISSGDVVEWQWTGAIDHTSTSDATTGPDSWDSGLLGTGAIYQSPVLSEGVHPYYCIPHGGPGGVGMSGTITVQADCTNGQVGVAISFTEQGGGFGGFQVLVDGNIAGTFSYDPTGSNMVSVNIPGDGQSHAITVQDIDDPSCTASTSITTPDCNASTCQLTVDALEAGGCDANDEVPVELTVSDVGGGNNGFDVLVDGNSVGTFPYDASGTTLVTINVIGDGQSHTIDVQDVEDNGCSSITNITTSDCAIPCQINNLSLTVSGSGDPVTHVVEVQDFEFVPASITVSVGDVVRFEWTGAIEHTATSDAISGPDVFDSGLMGQGSVFEVTISTEGEHPYYCIPHGAPGGIGMSGVITAVPPTPCNNGLVDLIVAFEETNSTSNTFNLLVDGNLTTSSPYTYNPDGNNQVTLSLPGDGMDHQITVQDTGDPTCNASQNVTLPDCDDTGAPCSLDFTADVTSGCDANEEVTVTVTIMVQNPGAMGYNLFLDGSLYSGSPFDYDPSGTTVQNIQVIGDGGSHEIMIEDVEVADCTISKPLSVPDCSAVCAITNLGVQLPENQLHQIEVQDFEFVPSVLNILVGDTIVFVWTGAIEHTATSDVTTGPNSFDSGLLGQGATFQVIITEAGAHPYYCIPHGAPGGIGMSGVINASTPCDNDLQTVGLQFNNAGTSSQFNIFLDDELYSGSPFGYNLSGDNEIDILVPGDGGTHTVRIEDVEEEQCEASQTFTVSECSAVCQVALSAEQIGDCDDELNVEYELEVLSFNAGNEGFELLVDGNAYPGSPFSYNTNDTTLLTILLSGDGDTHEIIINDIGNPDCSDQLTVEVPLCSNECALTLSAMQTGPCDNGEVPFELSVDATNGGMNGYNLFTGGIPHPDNPFPYNGSIVSVNLTGDGTTQQIKVEDADDPECSDSITLNVPDCSAGCTIDNLGFEVGVPTIHEVEVQDFEFVPSQITINIGDVVRFIWVGAIPHTATSDVMSGEDSFNSGLLGQGAIFEVTINSSGPHSYYCIPHGAPGGIGMSGVINAVDPCEDGLLAVAFTFTDENGGFSGYNVTIDGTLTVGSPYDYGDSGMNTFVVELPGDGNTHDILIEDVDDTDCRLETNFDMPDCDDECFGFEAIYSYESDPQSFETIFTDESTGEPDSWQWDFGDGNTSLMQNPGHTFDSEGDYEVCLIATNSTLGCSDTTCQVVSVGAFICEPDFTYENDGLTIQFSDASVTSELIQDWTWKLGNGLQIVGQQHPEYTYPELGVYEVCLEIEAGECMAERCTTLDLSNPCLTVVPDFTYTVNPNNALGIQFVDLTEGEPTHWLWGFGDGHTSNDPNPYHEYDVPGYYNICLLVQDGENGCNEAECREIHVGLTGVVNRTLHNHSLLIFPNPSDKNIRTWSIRGIQVADFYQQLPWKMYNIQGRNIATGLINGSQEIQIEVEQALGAGLYFLEIRSSEAVYRGRIIIQ